jgi:hypothetical protein
MPGATEGLLKLVRRDVSTDMQNASNVDPPIGAKVEDDMSGIDEGAEPLMKVIASPSKPWLLGEHFEIVT